MASETTGQQWVKPEALRAALGISSTTVARMRKHGQIVKGRDYLELSPTCFRYNVDAVLKALGAKSEHQTDSADQVVRKQSRPIPQHLDLGLDHLR